MSLAPLPPGGLIFAPMEGVTDAAYRATVEELFPEWDVLATDFLRVPRSGLYPPKHLVAHQGAEVLRTPRLNAKTMFQILTSEDALTAQMVEGVAAIGVDWLDLNLGCPSNTVCKNGGGSFLLKDLQKLERIVKLVRTHFPRRFSCKVRVGWADGASFQDTIRLLNDCGVELITVHGRTREMMYKEPARWDWIAEAVRVSRVPIVGNGDVWSPEDARRMLEHTGCYAVMVARGALKTPWFPLWMSGAVDDAPQTRLELARSFLSSYSQRLIAGGIREHGLVKQMKGITRYIFDGVDESEALRRRVLLSQNAQQLFSACGFEHTSA